MVDDDLLQRQLSEMRRVEFAQRCYRRRNRDQTGDKDLRILCRALRERKPSMFVRERFLGFCALSWLLWKMAIDLRTLLRHPQSAEVATDAIKRARRYVRDLTVLSFEMVNHRRKT